MVQDENDEELVGVLNTVSRRQPTTKPVEVSSTPLPTDSPTAHMPKAPESTPLLPVAAATADLSNYEALLLQVNRNKKGKGIQLDPHTHRTLCHIVRIMGCISLSDLLQNMVHIHFQQFGPKIQKMLAEKERLNKKEPLLFQQG